MTATSELAMVARVGGALLVVVVLALLAARLARRTSMRGGGVGLRVVDRAGLTRESAVAVVEVAGRGLILGVTTRAVNVLAELTAEELAAAAAPGTGPDTGTGDDPGSGAGRRPAGRLRDGSVLDPRIWKQALDGLRELTTRR